MKREIWAVCAIVLIASAMIMAVLVSGFFDTTVTPNPSPSSDPPNLDGVRVIAIGPANLTTYGYMAIPVNVTNGKSVQLNMREVNFTVTLADGSTIEAYCNGPDIVAAHQTKEFLIVANVQGAINVTIINLVMGNHYANCAVPSNDPSSPIVSPGPSSTIGPSPITNPTSSPSVDPSTLPLPTPTPAPTPATALKKEPKVVCSLSESWPFRPAYHPYSPPFYGEPSTGEVDTWVSQQADASHIGIVIYFVGLHADQVFVNSSYAGGPPVWANIYNDGEKGCYGLLLDDPATISGDMGWTWMYSGSGRAEYHNTTLSVTTYALGTHEVRFYAYDQDTGKPISDVEVSSFTVYGSGGKFNPYYMFDTKMSTDFPYPFVPGQVYNFTFEDSCRYPSYSGTVRSTCSPARTLRRCGSLGTTVRGPSLHATAMDTTQFLLAICRRVIGPRSPPSGAIGHTRWRSLSLVDGALLGRRWGDRFPHVPRQWAKLGRRKLRCSGTVERPTMDLIRSIRAGN